MQGFWSFLQQISTCNLWSRAVRAQNQAPQKVGDSWVSKDHLQQSLCADSLPNIPLLIHLHSTKRRLVSLPRANLYGIAKEKEEGKGEAAKIHLLLLSKVLQQLTQWEPENAFLKRFATQRTDFQISSIISSSSRARTRIFAWAYLC